MATAVVAEHRPHNGTTLIRRLRRSNDHLKIIAVVEDPKSVLQGVDASKSKPSKISEPSQFEWLDFVRHIIDCAEWTMTSS